MTEELEPACFVLNEGYTEYLEYMEFVHKNSLGWKLHQLSESWRHRHVRFAISEEELARAQENFIHADGSCTCSDCGERYRDHPIVLGCEWLHALCNGMYVKL